MILSNEDKQDLKSFIRKEIADGLKEILKEILPRVLKEHALKSITEELTALSPTDCLMDKTSLSPTPRKHIPEKEIITSTTSTKEAEWQTAGKKPRLDENSAIKQQARILLQKPRPRVVEMMSVHYLGFSRKPLSKFRKGLSALGIDTTKVFDISFIGQSVCELVIDKKYVHEFGSIVTTELSEVSEIADYDPADFTFSEKTLNKSLSRMQQLDTVTQRLCNRARNAQTTKLALHYEKDLEAAFDSFKADTRERQEAYQRWETRTPKNTAIKRPDSTVKVPAVIKKNFTTAKADNPSHKAEPLLFMPTQKKLIESKRVQKTVAPSPLKETTTMSTIEKSDSKEILTPKTEEPTATNSIFPSHEQTAHSQPASNIDIVDAMVDALMSSHRGGRN